MHIDHDADGKCVAVMLTGVTGAGKSTACNFIFGEAVFEVGMGLVSVTSKSDVHETVMNGRQVRLIDTPGFCDNFEKDEDKVEELGKAIILAKEGVHAIALVINAAHRFTSAEAKALEEIQLLGELWPFMFVIFTAAKSYGTSEDKQKKAVIDALDSSRCPHQFKTMMERVQRRFMMLESTENNAEYRCAKVQEFLAMVDQIFSVNQRLYSNYYFQKANKLYQEAKQKEQNKEEELRKALENATKMSAEMIAAMAALKSEQAKQQAIFQQTLSSLTSQLKESQQANQMIRKRMKEMEDDDDDGWCNIL